MLMFESHIQCSSLPLTQIWKLGVSKHGNGISTRVLVGLIICYTLAGYLSYWKECLDEPDTKTMISQ
ncbi:hypothetical protein Bca101_019051 [Brassica carinata]